MPDSNPLAGIKPDKRGRGYSTFTAEQGAKIKAAYMGGMSQVAIGKYLGVSNQVIHAICAGTRKYSRPNLSGQYKEDYARRKLKRWQPKNMERHDDY